MWMTMDNAARHYGYSSSATLRQRIRQLREAGKVSDEGNSPDGCAEVKDAPIRIFWAHPRTMMIADNAPADLLNPKRGRRP